MVMSVGEEGASIKGSVGDRERGVTWGTHRSSRA